jgi:hypothetical protein
MTCSLFSTIRLSLISNKFGRLSAFLSLEIVLAFHQTSNNVLRFHRFMEAFLESAKNCGDLRFLGRLNVVEAFQQYCIQKYGNFDGTMDVDGRSEGVLRHQPSQGHPISLHRNLVSLNALMLSLKGASSEPCNATRYTTLVNEVKRVVLGLGDLKAQKLIMNCASLGLFLPVASKALPATKILLVH